MQKQTFTVKGDMARYIVKDPQGVYDDETIEVPFKLRESAMLPLTAREAEAVLVRVAAIEMMYGCPLGDVSTKHALEMLRSVKIEEEGE